MDGRGFEAPSRDAEGVEGVGNGEVVPLPSRLGGLGERRELPQRGPGRSPGRKTDFSASKRHRMPFVETFVVN